MEVSGSPRLAVYHWPPSTARLPLAAYSWRPTAGRLLLATYYDYYYD